jgi:hypothetical protein
MELFLPLGYLVTQLGNLYTATIWLNFTNILRTDFSHEIFARSFFVLAVKVKLFIGAKILAQMLS